MSEVEGTASHAGSPFNSPSRASSPCRRRRASCRRPWPCRRRWVSCRRPWPCRRRWVSCRRPWPCRRRWVSCRRPWPCRRRWVSCRRPWPSRCASPRCALRRARLRHPAGRGRRGGPGRWLRVLRLRRELLARLVVVQLGLLLLGVVRRHRVGVDQAVPGVGLLRVGRRAILDVADCGVGLLAEEELGFRDRHELLVLILRPFIQLVHGRVVPGLCPDLEPADDHHGNEDDEADDIAYGRDGLLGRARLLRCGRTHLGHGTPLRSLGGRNAAGDADGRPVADRPAGRGTYPGTPRSNPTPTSAPRPARTVNHFRGPQSTLGPGESKDDDPAPNPHPGELEDGGDSLRPAARPAGTPRRHPPNLLGWRMPATRRPPRRDWPRRCLDIGVRVARDRDHSWRF